MQLSVCLQRQPVSMCSAPRKGHLQPPRSHSLRAGRVARSLSPVPTGQRRDSHITCLWLPLSHCPVHPLFHLTNHL